MLCVRVLLSELLQLLSKDEISMELGVDPRAAADLSIVLQRGHNPCESKTPEIQMLPPPPPPGGSGNNKQDASAKPGHNEPKNNEQPPKKKSRPPKPQAGFHGLKLRLQ